MKAFSLLASFLLLSVAAAQYAGYYEYTSATGCTSGINVGRALGYPTDKCFKPNQASEWVPGNRLTMFSCNSTHVILTQYADADTECQLPLSSAAFARNQCDQEAKWDCFSEVPSLADVDSSVQVTLEVTYFNDTTCGPNDATEFSADGFKACEGNIKTFCYGQSIVREICDEGCESGCQTVSSMPVLPSKCTTSEDGNWAIRVDSTSEAQSALPVCKGVQGTPSRSETSAAEAKAPSAWILAALILVVLF
mmetsp:Transcript_11504/g.15977  ORF Transcript_11504/g.15977 Transcript_11504/m.15977 type:complete len:251 (-) Transcript_11504:1497-2249(-)